MKALFVIDMQEEYVGEGNHYGYESSALINQVNKRILQAQQEHELIIYIQNRKRLKGDVITPELAKKLQVLSQYIFYKEKASLFSNEEIVRFLQEKGITEIETIGIDGNCCVAASAMEAVALGFAVTFPCRYIGVKNSMRFCKKKAALVKLGVAVIEESFCLL